MNILKLLLILINVAVGVSLGVEKWEIARGYEIYKNNCSVCHLESISLKDFLRARMHVLKGEKPDIDAPPMNLVSAKIKQFYSRELEFVEFVKDYITHPSKDKGVCNKAAYSFFGTMPPIGEGMSEEEKELVAKWMYYNFEGIWLDIFLKVKQLEEALHSKK